MSKHAPIARTLGFALAAVALAASCHHPDLANTNIADKPGGVPLDPPTTICPFGQLCPGGLLVLNEKLNGIRTAMNTFLGGPDATVATLSINECTAQSCCGDPTLVNSCLRVGYKKAPDVLPNLVTAPGFPAPDPAPYP